MAADPYSPEYWKECSVCHEKEGPFLYEENSAHPGSRPEMLRVELPPDMFLSGYQRATLAELTTFWLKSGSNLFQVMCLSCLKRAILFGKLSVIANI